MLFLWLCRHESATIKCASQEIQSEVGTQGSNSVIVYSEGANIAYLGRHLLLVVSVIVKGGVLQCLCTLSMLGDIFDMLVLFKMGFHLLGNSKV